MTAMAAPNKRALMVQNTNSQVVSLGWLINPGTLKSATAQSPTKMMAKTMKAPSKIRL